MHGYLKMVVTSDLHFGNPKIDPNSMLLKLRKFLYPELRDCHLFIIAGDLYDQLLTVGSKAHVAASNFISDIFTISDFTGMQVRILHGTYTHDRDQLSVFSALATDKTRYKIVNHIECEEISDLRCGQDVINTTLKVGYLPDNLSYRHSEDVLGYLQKVMTCLGWGHLDLLIGHGTFAHVIRSDGHRPPCLYEQAQFKDIVQGPIVMGHIHTPGRNHNVYYCGSFERLAHGEEEKKGFYVFTLDEKRVEGWRSRFVVNDLAVPFVTILPEGDDIPEIMKNFTSQVDDKLPTGRGYLRVVHKSPEVRSILHKVCAQQYPHISYSSKSTGETDATEIKVDEITLDLFDDVHPDVHNLGGLVYQFLADNNMLGDVTQEQILSHTEEVLKVLRE